MAEDFRSRIQKFVPTSGELESGGKVGMYLQESIDVLRMFGCQVSDYQSEIYFGSCGGKPVKWRPLGRQGEWFTSDFHIPFHAHKSISEIITIDEWRHFRNAYDRDVNQMRSMIKADDPYYKTYLSRKEDISNLDGYIQQRTSEMQARNQQSDYDALKKRLDRFGR